MKRTGMLLLLGFAFAGLTSAAHAQAIGDAELLAAASAVSTANLDRGTLAQVDVISAPESDSEVSVENVVRDRALKPAGLQADDDELEGPESEAIEGPDLDGPGGSTHEFQGEEEGDH